MNEIEQLNYDLGLLAIGSISYRIPTLSTDNLKSGNVIKVHPQDESTHSRLEAGYWKLLSNSNNSKDQNVSSAFNKVVESSRELARKYLPKKIKLSLPDRINITNKEMFHKGINDALWDLDYSWYSAKDDFYEVFEHGRTTLNLTLVTNG